MHQKNYKTIGKEIKAGSKVLIMLHGRGASAEDIIGLSTYLNVNEFSIVAPQATNHTWYPYSFMAPTTANEPWLGSAIELIDGIVEDLLKKGVDKSSVFFLGFSQGACLTLEYVTRNATKYGGVVAFTGGLIGETLDSSQYSGDFNGTPVFIGTSDPDPHVPVSRVNETEKVLSGLNATVTKKIYPGMGHTIIQDEIDQANKILTANLTS